MAFWISIDKAGNNIDAERSENPQKTYNYQGTQNARKTSNISNPKVLGQVNAALYLQSTRGIYNPGFATLRHTLPADLNERTVIILYDNARDGRRVSILALNIFELKFISTGVSKQDWNYCRFKIVSKIVSVYWVLYIINIHE